MKETYQDRKGKRTVGLGELNCKTCKEQAERGCTLPGKERFPGAAVKIDNTGDDSHDIIYCCPAGLRVREPFAAETLRTYQEMRAAGGPGPNWSGDPVAWQPPRVSWTWTCLKAIESRFRADIEETRADIQKSLRGAL